MSEPMTFVACVAQCAAIPGFVAQYDRLTGSHLADVLSASPLNAAIDDATGHKSQEFARFAAFVYEIVWTRLAPEVTP